MEQLNDYETLVDECDHEVTYGGGNYMFCGLCNMMLPVEENQDEN